MTLLTYAEEPRDAPHLVKVYVIPLLILDNRRNCRSPVCSGDNCTRYLKSYAVGEVTLRIRCLSPRLYDWSVSSEHLGFLFLVFFISLFCCGSVRQIKLVIC